MTAHGSCSLSDYLTSAFKAPVVALPVNEENHVTWWRERFTQHGGSAQALVESLNQFQVTIEPGASQSPEYVRLIRQGQPVSSPRTANDLFSSPSMVDWHIVDHSAGGLPVLTFAERADFEIAFRALGARCEPVPVGKNVHALYLGGLPNPVRAGELREAFLGSGHEPQAWPEEVQRRMQADGTSFHDRLILVHPAPYGGLSSSVVGDSMDEHDWILRSMQLRIEHECTHHATHRLLGSYRLHVHDEVLADLMGFTKALGRFDAGLFLRALGVSGNDVAPEARLLTYTSDLEEKALPRLVDLLHQVAERVESFSSVFVDATDLERLKRLVVLAQIDLVTLSTRNPDDLAELLVGD